MLREMATKIEGKLGGCGIREVRRKKKNQDRGNSYNSVK